MKDQINTHFEQYSNQADYESPPPHRRTWWSMLFGGAEIVQRKPRRTFTEWIIATLCRKR